MVGEEFLSVRPQLVPVLDYIGACGTKGRKKVRKTGRGREKEEEKGGGKRGREKGEEKGKTKVSRR